MVIAPRPASPSRSPALPAARRQQPGGRTGPSRRAPGGTSPLPAGIASGGMWRPHRLVYGEGTPLTCRPDGQFGPSWTGTAVGAVPAPGEASGWLQAIRRDDGDGDGRSSTRPCSPRPGSTRTP